MTGTAAGLASAAVSASAPAAEPSAQEFAGGEAPQPPAADDPTRVLVEGEYEVQDSAADREPLWSSEHLTAAQVEGAAGGRKDRFHAETQLSPDQRAELSDYAGAKGFDRGHMSPVGDMDTAEAKDQSFTLANMVPQSSVLNEGLWAGIEAQVRALADREGSIWVVTGPEFDAHPEMLKGRVAVPSDTWKAVYGPKLGAGAYLTPNDDSGQWSIISIDELTKLIGFDVFPGLPAELKATAAALPPPDPKSIHHRAR